VDAALVTLLDDPVAHRIDPARSINWAREKNLKECPGKA
jgi:hypothetical protein